MSRKKRQKNLRRMVAGVTIVILLIIFFIIILFSRITGGNYYSIEKRVDKISNTKVDDSDYSTIAWLRVQGTNIDMPIVWSSDKNAEFPVQLESFAWSNNSDKKFHNQINIVGHNIFNLSSKPKIKDERFHRFEELLGFVYYDFAKENKYIQLTIDGKDYLYKIYSVNFINQSTSTFIPYGDDFSKEQRKEYLKLMLDSSLYDYDVDLDSDDKYISLETCTRFFGADRSYNFFINGRLLRDGEEVNNYKVIKNKKNYKEIENKMKDVDKNGEDSL